MIHGLSTQCLSFPFIASYRTSSLTGNFFYHGMLTMYCPFFKEQLPVAVIQIKKKLIIICAVFLKDCCWA